MYMKHPLARSCAVARRNGGIEDEATVPVGLSAEHAPLAVFRRCTFGRFSRQELDAHVGRRESTQLHHRASPFASVRRHDLH